MKSRKLMCYGPYCHPDKIKHNREAMITHKRKHYCKKCWNYLKEQRHYRYKLYRYIEFKAHVPYPNGIMLRDIKMLNRKYHYTYRGIGVALEYANKFSVNFRFNGSFFLRYVPFVYDKAQAWRYNRDRHNNLMLNSTHINNQVEHATVKHEVFEPKKKIPHYDMNKF